MPVLKNPRHERFAQELAKGKSATEAYGLAGYKPDDGNAARLTGKDSLKARVAEIMGKGAEKAAVTIHSIAVQLDEDRKLAHKIEQPGAAVSASVAKAKLFGLMPDKHELTGANGGPIEHRDTSPEAVKNAIDELFAGPAAKPGSGDPVVH